jgi:hypothetical protein
MVCASCCSVMVLSNITIFFCSPADIVACWLSSNISQLGAWTGDSRLTDYCAVLSVAADRREHSYSWFPAPSLLLTQFIFVPIPCVWKWDLLFEERMGLVFLSKPHICCTALSRACRLTCAVSRSGCSCFMGTIHALSLFCNGQFLCKVHTAHLSMQASAAD